MFAHCVDKGSLDMLRKIVLTTTMMMELEAILTLREGKPVTIVENVKTLTSFTYLFWNLMVWLCKFFLPFSPLHSLSQYVSHSFHSNIWIYSSNFYTGASYYPDLWTVLSPSCFNKTSHLVFAQCWLLHFDMRSSIWFTLAIFPKLITLSRNNCPWGETTSQTSSLTPYTIWHPQKQPLWLFHVLLYYGSFKLNHLTRDDWIDLKWLCVDWYFSGQTAIIIQKFCNLWHHQLPPMQQLLVLSVPTQQVIRWLNWEEEWRQKVCLVQIKESDEESCVEDNST